MPIYTYRREDGTTFDIRQKFSDDALTVDPETGQKVSRVIHSAGVIFKGSGYYVTDNRKANNPAAPKNGKDEKPKSETSSSSKESSDTTSSSSKSESKSKSSSPAAAD